MSSRTESFTSAALLARLCAFPVVKRYLVGFSGGADSTALLHALFQQHENIKGRIEACHFNHGLSTHADEWQKHCETFCADRDIPLHCHTLNLTPDQPNLESTARDLRYQWVENHIDAETLYLTAHHADDRAETFLLNALRGSGLDGVSSIPRIRELGQGHVARPLLDFPRSSLCEYLERHDLAWIEDPSNQDSGPDRNFIRNEVIPLMESRWPAARRSLARTAGHIDSGNILLKKLLQSAQDLSGSEHRLPLSALTALGDQSASLVLRHWLQHHRVPESRLSEFLDQLSKSDSESRCELTWDACSLRLFNGDLYLSDPGNFRACPEREWVNEPVLSLGDELGSIRMSGHEPTPLSDWVIGPRQSGAKMRLHAGGPGRKLKHILQEQRIPPWQRNSVPILYQGNDILAIGDWQFSPEFAEWLTTKNLKYLWQPDRSELIETQKRCHTLDP